MTGPTHGTRKKHDMNTDTLPDTLAELQRLIDQVSDRLTTIVAAVDRLPATAAPSYHPERMGYLSELRRGDRVLFAGGWREVATWFQHHNGVVEVTFTDPDMYPLVDKGTHAIRIQKRADEQQADVDPRREHRLRVAHREVLVAATRALIAVVEHDDALLSYEPDELNEPWASALAAVQPFLPEVEQ